ncbi:MAG: TonB-dependent receptor [Alphaproteobacteria bacterium]|nr:TonB-dependent receptor [Alphaproteobacteria bacterium]
MRSLSSRHAAFILAASSSFALASAAHAQATGPVVPENSANPPVGTAPAAAGDTAQSGGLEDIIVTATRREERLQNVPVTVTAITAKSLAVADVATVRDLTQVIPGFVGSRNAGVFQPVIRGVGSTGISSGDEPNVATYIDGVYQPETGANWIDLVEVERVEVLRGPQGTVFGRNATGGLINVITPDPKFTPGGRLAVKYGFMRNDAQDLDIRGYVTGPLTSNVAADISVLYKDLGGYIKDLLRPGGGLGDMKVKDIRSKLLFKPSDRAQIVLTGEVFDQTSHVNAFQPYENNTVGFGKPGVILPTGPWQASVRTQAAGDTRPYINLKRYNLALHTRFEFDAFNLETTSGYLDYKWFQRTDSDSTNIFFGDFPANIFSQSFSQEVRVLSTGPGRLQWLVGGYFYYLDGGSSLRIITPAAATKLDPALTVKSWAGFAEGTYELADTLFLTAGVRYTTEDRTFKQVVNGVPLSSTFGPPPRFPADGEAKASFNKWTYRGALRWQFAEDANIYVSYGTGFKSGVFNMAGTNPNPVSPETIKTIEGGIKADPLPWLRTNLSIYHNDYKDLQVQAKDPNSSINYILLNASNAKIYGGEFELTASPNSDLNIRGIIAYIHGRYENLDQAPGFTPLRDANGVLIGGNATLPPKSASGKTLTRAPKFTFNLGFDWAHEMAGGKFGIAGNIFHSGKLYYDFLNIFFQKAYTLANGQVSWTTADDKLRFFVWGTNLTNAKVWQTLRPSGLGTDGFYEQPRKVGVGAEVRF